MEEVELTGCSEITFFNSYLLQIPPQNLNNSLGSPLLQMPLNKAHSSHFPILKPTKLYYGPEMSLFEQGESQAVSLKAVQGDSCSVVFVASQGSVNHAFSEENVLGM